MDLRFLTSLILLLCLFFVNSNTAAGQVGVCYGGKGNNLPSPTETVALFRLKNIRRIRTYDADQKVLAALRGSGIEVMLGLSNGELKNVASSQSDAVNWVRTNVYNYPDVNFRYISVGNEVKTTDSFAQFLVPAMENIHRGLSTFGLQDRIKVSTAIDMSMLSAESYPPSKGSFKGEVMVLMKPIIGFLVNKKSPLHLNVYPYFSYAESPQIRLDYALFKAPPGTVSDINQISYQNLFDAMLDTVYSALEKSDGGSLEIVVSETGWPTEAGKDTNVENARIYNNNLINHVKKGTPKRPGKEIETYIFAMYDENQKTIPPEVERFWGLFNPNKQPKYDVNFV